MLSCVAKWMCLHAAIVRASSRKPYYGTLLKTQIEIERLAVRNGIQYLVKPVQPASSKDR